MINYQEIIENLRDEDVFRLLDQLGAQPIDKGDFFICKTICHNEDANEASSKLYYYKNTHLFYCFTECHAMNIFKFLKNYYETRSAVYDWHQDILQVILNCSAHKISSTPVYKSQRENYELKKARKDLITYPNGIMDMFSVYYPYEWLNDRISKESMDKYNIRFSSLWNKIIIPHYDVEGRLVGIRGRALDPVEAEQFGKYVPVQIEGKFYSHPLSLNLYGLHLNKDNIKKYGICYISEGEKGVLQAEDFKMPNCTVASCGSNLNKFQIDLLVRYCQPKEIVVCYDQEELPGQCTYFNKLYNMCKKYRNYANMSFIYDRQHLLGLKDSPFDKGEKVFYQLVNSRVKI